MRIRRAPRSRGALLFLALGMLPSLPACSVFEIQDRIPDRARVVVSGVTPVPLELVTSTKFERRLVRDQDAEIRLIRSDTLSLTLEADFDREYQVKPDIGFLVRLTNRDTIPAVISIQVYFDGALAYDQPNVTMRDSSVEFTKFFINDSYVR